MSATTRDAQQRTAEIAAGPASAVSVQKLSKTFRLPREQYHTLKERALHPFRSRVVDTLRAVDDVSFEISPGEFFGIVGANGSGKSTLLKCIAGIYAIDGGTLDVHGRLSPFIELGVGFNPDLTAADNVIINAIMLGLSRKEALARFDDIVAFAELENFMKLKLKNYSSGMQVRLAFAVAIQVDADILLIDEVLAVGDAAFQKKCFDEFTRLKAAGRTIVFVTHDMAAVERFCDRAMLMDHGRVLEVGEPAAIARRYNEVNLGRARRRASELPNPDGARHPAVAEVVGVSFERENGATMTEMLQGEIVVVRLDVYFHADTVNPVFLIGLRNERGVTAFGASSAATHGPTGAFRAGTRAVVRVRLENWLAPGLYQASASLVGDGEHSEPYDVREHVSSLFVHAWASGGGAVDLPHTFSIDRC